MKIDVIAEGTSVVLPIIKRGTSIVLGSAEDTDTPANAYTDWSDVPYVDWNDNFYTDWT